MTAKELTRELRWAKEQMMDAAHAGDLEGVKYHAAEVKALARKLEAAR